MAMVAQTLLPLEDDDETPLLADEEKVSDEEEVLSLNNNHTAQAERVEKGMGDGGGVGLSHTPPLTPSKYLFDGTCVSESVCVCVCMCACQGETLCVRAKRERVCDCMHVLLMRERVCMNVFVRACVHVWHTHASSRMANGTQYPIHSYLQPDICICS